MRTAPQVAWSPVAYVRYVLPSHSKRSTSELLIPSPGPASRIGLNGLSSQSARSFDRARNGVYPLWPGMKLCK